MKFKKIVTIGIDESDLDPAFWNRVDEMTESRVTLKEDDSKILSELADADCLLVKFNGVPKEILEKAPNLRYVGVLATGYGKVDLDVTKQMGIVVSNVPGYSTESVAEFVLAVIMERIRGLSVGLARAKDGNYSEDDMQAYELNGKNFGVIGLGQIGNRVAELAHGFGAEVSYWDRGDKNGSFQRKEFEQLLADSDFISINLALTPDTEGILNETLIKAIKPGAVMVNTAPMELLDLHPLEERLKKGDFTFIIDHTDEMTEADLKRLKQYDNCVLYPPIAYISDEARVAKQDIFVSNIKAALAGMPTNKVN